MEIKENAVDDGWMWINVGIKIFEVFYRMTIDLLSVDGNLKF